MAETPSFEKATLAWTLPWEDAWVTAVAFVGGSRKLAAGNQRGRIYVWDLPEKPGDPAPAPVRFLDGHTNQVTRLAATPDGRWLVSASYDHTLRLWDMQAPASGTAEVILDARSRAAAAKKAGPKPPLPAPGVKVEVQQAQHVLEGHREWVQALALSSDGSVIYSGDDAGQVIVWDRAAAKETRRWKLKGWAWAMALSADNAQLCISERIPVVFTPVDHHSAVKVWDAATGQAKLDLSKEFKMHIGAAAFAPDGKLLALGPGGESDVSKVFLVDPASGKKVRELQGHQYGVTDLRFSADGRYLFSCGRDTLCRVWLAADGKKVAELGKPRGGQFKDWLHALSLSPDEHWLAAADMLGQVVVYNA